MEYVLVTGGLGFIGSHCCVELLNSNYNLIIVDNCSNSRQDVIDRIKSITNRNPIHYNVDLLDACKLECIFKEYKIWCVIHLAAFKSVNESINRPLYYYENNVTSTINLLSVMSAHGCKKIIFSSSATVYGKQNYPVDEGAGTGIGITNPYGKTKYFIEEILKDVCTPDKEWSVIILRYFNPVGAHPSGQLGEDPLNTPNNLFPHILKASLGGSKLMIYGGDYNTYDGTCIRDFIHVVDLARGHISSLRLINNPGCYIYNLGTGTGASVLDIIGTFERVNNIRVNYEITSRREGDLESVYANVNKSNIELDWKAEKSLEDICRDGFNFYTKTIRKNPNN
jgi:UDP-glucose 4-epimerase